MSTNGVVKKILLVDDDSDILMMFEAVLSSLGQIISAINGQEALEVIQRSNPDLVITDNNMPVMDGAELVRRLRAMGMRIPIIMLSARFCEAIDELREEMLRLDVFCLSKPVDINLLSLTARQMLHAL